MELLTYLSSLSIPNLFSRMPAAAAQGIIWGIMALGVYITFRLLNVSDLTVDGSFATGGAVTVMLLLQGLPAWRSLRACCFRPRWLRCYIGTSAPNREARCAPRARTPR